MQDSTTHHDADATLAVGTIRLDVTTLAERIAQLVIRGLVARAGAEDIHARLSIDKLTARPCPSCGNVFWGDASEPQQLCATCQQHGDLRDRE